MKNPCIPAYAMNHIRFELCLRYLRSKGGRICGRDCLPLLRPPFEVLIASLCDVAAKLIKRLKESAPEKVRMQPEPQLRDSVLAPGVAQARVSPSTCRPGTRMYTGKYKMNDSPSLSQAHDSHCDEADCERMAATTNLGMLCHRSPYCMLLSVLESPPVARELPGGLDPHAWLSVRTLYRQSAWGS